MALLRTAWLFTIGVALLAAGGCVGGEAATPAAATPRIDLRSPMVYGGDNGLEIRSWRVERSPTELAEIFEELEEGTPEGLSAIVDRRWGGEGLRVLRIPLAELGRLSDALASSSTRSTHWLGRGGAWTVIARGASWGATRPLLVQGEPLALDGGALRLLARAWTTPTLDRPRLQVELAIQHRTRNRRDGIEEPFRPARIEPLEQEGLLFRDLTLQASLEPGYAYLIAPSAPEEEGAAFGVAGPFIERPPSVGHALLCAREEIDELRERRRSTIIALIPRAPERLRLLSIVERAF